MYRKLTYFTSQVSSVKRILSFTCWDCSWTVSYWFTVLSLRLIIGSAFDDHHHHENNFSLSFRPCVIMYKLFLSEYYFQLTLLFEWGLVP